MADKELYIYKSKLAEQAERYEDMVEWMHKVALAEPEMTVEERNLLSVAYKNVIGAKRTSWRIVTTLEQKEEEKLKTKREPEDSNQHAKDLSIIKNYKQQIEGELRTTCQQVLELLDTILVAPKTIDGSAESKVFYYKMKGDYFRYMAEISSKQEKENPAQESLKAYKEASDIGQALDSTHPIRLGLALNFSVFFYEILGDPSRACKVAKTAFDDAIKDLDKLPEENYKDATLIMQLLRDNLTLWTSDMERKDEIEDTEQLQDIE